jgi:1-acyl-sn-glycerol-3-phosphate acyltransferase
MRPPASGTPARAATEKVILTAAKHPLKGQLVRWLIDWSLHQHFSQVLVREATPLAQLDRTLPLLYLVSHVAWWDGYLMVRLNRRAGRDDYIMMEERQLARYGFFRWVGCFSVDRDHPRRALASLRYAATLLSSQPNRAVVVFPQGQIVANDRRPVALATGAARLCRLVDRRLLVVPVALRYEHRGEQHPAAFISTGPPLQVQPSEGSQPHALTERFRTLLEGEMDHLRASILSDDLTTFHPLMAGRASVNDRYDRWRARLPWRRR